MQDSYIKLESGHHHTSMIYHLVWSTKNRVPHISSKYKKELYNYISGIIHNKKWLLLSIGGPMDHVHILLQKTPKYTISDVISSIKANSSRFMRENFVKEFSWQQGYGAFTVDSRSIPELRQYIAKQEIHHQQMSFEKEWELLLKRYELKK